ncbi:MAG: 30S ribosomal protein S17 [Fidelibacterota bacterium]|nr:MAG: 30S ribosomal protein S17 [Candidatus Neomarinimicrobiota bacterium]
MVASESRRRRLVGEVVSNQMDKTVVVLVTRRIAHPVYRKYVTKTKRYYAHDERNECQQGDKVIIEGTRPLSRLKRWRIVEVTQPAVAGVAEL